MKLEGLDLTFGYGGHGRRILDGVNLRLESGERVGLVAPSGRGKTTLCKLLAGCEKPTRGAVLLDDKPLSAWRGACPVQMIWQHPELVVNPRFRMGDVLREGGEVPRRILDGLHIEAAWYSRFPAELSGGELQRFCIARALGARTRFLLCDEMTAMLDLITQSQIWQFLMEETARREIGVLAVSHSDSLLAQVCTRTATLG